MFNSFFWKRALNFDDKEVATMVVISVLSGFILSFRMWGTERFDTSEGLSNLLLFSLIFLLLFFVFILSQKVVAASLGLDARVHVWKYGPPVGVLITLMTYGLVPFVFLGGVSLKEIPRLRLGKFRRTVINVKEMLYIGLVGPFSLIFLSLLVFFPLYLLTGSDIFYSFIWVSSLILVVSAIPLPSLNGLNLLLKYRAVWVIYFLFALFLYILFGFLMHPLAYVIALFSSVLFAWLLKKAVHDRL